MVHFICDPSLNFRPESEFLMEKLISSSNVCRINIYSCCDSWILPFSYSGIILLALRRTNKAHVPLSHHRPQFCSWCFKTSIAISCESLRLGLPCPRIHLTADDTDVNIFLLRSALTPNVSPSPRAYHDRTSAISHGSGAGGY
jgi:hypothetical protein